MIPYCKCGRARGEIWADPPYKVLYHVESLRAPKEFHRYRFSLWQTLIHRLSFERELRGF